MVIALIGSHGVGKTSVFNEIKKHKPEFLYFAEPVRHQMPAYGYKNPYEIIDKFGIGVFELLNINNWSVADPQVNTQIKPESLILLDRSAVDNYAYYLSLRKLEQDFLVEDLLKRMARYYAQLIDKFIYFPIGDLPLINDDMRIGDKNYQEKVDENIKLSLRILDIEHSKVYVLSTKKLNDRVQEVLEVIG